MCRPEEVEGEATARAITIASQVNTPAHDIAWFHGNQHCVERVQCVALIRSASLLLGELSCLHCACDEQECSPGHHEGEGEGYDTTRVS